MSPHANVIGSRFATGSAWDPVYWG